MKNFTRLFLSTMLLVGSSHFAHSQGDVGVTVALTPQPLGQIWANIPQQMSVTLTNYDSSPLTASQADSVVVELWVNGIYQTFVWAPPADLNLGASGTVDMTRNGSTDWSTMGLGNATQTVSICFKSRLKKGGIDVDTDPSNDELCYTVTYDGDDDRFTYDLSVIDVSLAGYSAGDHVPLGGLGIGLAYELKNNGPSDWFPGIPYSYDLTVGGVSAGTIDAVVFGFIGNGGQETHTINNNVTFPMTQGPFDICIDVAPNPDDTDNSNDKGCLSLNAGNPAGIADAELPVYGDIFYFGRNLNMKFNELAKGMVTVSIFETSGRTAGEFTLDVDLEKNHELNLSKLAAGMYIANVIVNGDLLTYQFVAE